MAQEGALVKYRTHILVWIALVALLLLTVGIARMGIGRFNIAAPLAIASVKTFLVLAFFMHLKYEGRFLKYLLFIILVILAVESWFIYFDVGYRG